MGIFVQLHMDTSGVPAAARVQSARPGRLAISAPAHVPLQGRRRYSNGLVKQIEPSRPRKAAKGKGSPTGRQETGRPSLGSQSQLPAASGKPGKRDPKGLDWIGLGLASHTTTAWAQPRITKIKNIVVPVAYTAFPHSLASACVPRLSLSQHQNPPASEPQNVCASAFRTVLFQLPHRRFPKPSIL